MHKFIGLLLVVSLFSISSALAKVGTAIIIKGPVLKGDFPLQEGDPVEEGATITTKLGGFARLQMNDKTIINIGSESALLIRTYKREVNKRKNVIKLLQGQFRILVKEHALDGEQIQFDSQQVSLGVRGTEFLSNSYMVGGAPSTDTLLIKGSLKVSGTGFNSFMMEPGQYFNSQEIIRNGLKAIKKATPEVLDSLKENTESLLPKIQTATGFVAPAIALASSLVPDIELGSSRKKEERPKVLPAKKKEEPKKVLKPKEAKKTSVKGPRQFSYDLRNEPWDIRDAVLNREKNKKENKCYYFFYKKLPGAGEPERFRRERDCDEFENDL